MTTAIENVSRAVGEVSRLWAAGAMAPGESVAKRGVPASCASNLLCDPGGWYSRLGRALVLTLTQLASAVWPVALMAVLMLVAVAVTWGQLRAMRRAQVAGRARWIEVACPAEVSPVGAAVFWRLLAARLASNWALGQRRRIAWELRATPAGVRVGLWVPSSMPATAVVAAISEAWPGAQPCVASSERVRVMQPPARLTAIRLRPAVPDWLPICSLDRPLSRHELPHEADLLRAVFGALSECRSADISVGVQILVRLARRWHARRSAAASRRLRGLPPRLWLIRRIPFAFFDIITGTEIAAPRRAAISPQIAHPLGQAKLRALTAKAAAGPHFEVAVRVTASGGSVAARRELVRAVAFSFGLVTLDAPVAVDLAVRRMWFPSGQLDTRHAPARHWFVVSLPEVAALASLPAVPARYGLIIAMARRFPPPPEVMAA